MRASNYEQNGDLEPQLWFLYLVHNTIWIPTYASTEEYKKRFSLSYFYQVATDLELG